MGKDPGWRRGRNIDVAVSNRRGVTGLEIIVRMSKPDAETLAGRAGRERAGAAFRQRVREALKLLDAPPPRNRGGLLQGDVPREVKQRLVALADRQGRNVTALLVAFLHRWINPANGKFRMHKKGKRRVRVAPSNLWDYAGQARISDGKVAGGRERLQVEVGSRVADRLNAWINDARIKKSLFLTAVVLDILAHEEAGVRKVPITESQLPEAQNQ